MFINSFVCFSTLKKYFFLFLVSVSATPQQMYQPQYQVQGGNGPSMQHHHMVQPQQQQQPPRQNFYQQPHIRMAAPSQGPRMPHMANNSPRGTMIQGGPTQQGHNGPTEVWNQQQAPSNPGGGNGHIPQAPPTGMPPNPQNQVGLNQQQAPPLQQQAPPPQPQPVYTFNVNQQQHAPIMMLHTPMASVVSQISNIFIVGQDRSFSSSAHEHFFRFDSWLQKLIVVPCEN